MVQISINVGPRIKIYGTDWILKVYMRLRPFDRAMLRLRPLSFVDSACHPETAGSRRTGKSIESIMAVMYLIHDQSILVTYVTDCYAKSWSNVFPSPTKLDQLYLLVQQKVGPTTGNLASMGPIRMPTTGKVLCRYCHSSCNKITKPA